MKRHRPRALWNPGTQVGPLWQTHHQRTETKTWCWQCQIGMALKGLMLLQKIWELMIKGWRLKGGKRLKKQNSGTGFSWTKNWVWKWCWWVYCYASEEGVLVGLKRMREVWPWPRKRRNRGGHSGNGSLDNVGQMGY